MKSPPLTLGIVTISYNQAPFLADAIDSVRLRDPSRLKYVIVDPGSTDGSREIISARSDRFSAILLERDRGPADGLNKGFSRCDADILGYINSDDRFVPGALDYVLEFFERNPDVDVIMGAIRHIDRQGKADPRARVPWAFSLQDYLDDTHLSIQQGTFFRRAAWARTGGFNIENRACWDTELLIDLILTGARIERIFRVLGEFRIYPESITGSQMFARDRLAIQRQSREDARLKQKIRDAGWSQTSKPTLWLKRAVFRTHPVRRILEWTVR